MHISREEYSLLHVNLANRKFAKRSLCKKGHLVVTKAHSASFFPNKHTSLLWPWLIFFCLAIDLSDIYKTIMLKLLLFCSGNLWNINHWWFFCTVCLMRKNILQKTCTSLLPIHLSLRISEIWPTSSYLKILYKTSSNSIYLLFYWSNSRTFPLA